MKILIVDDSTGNLAAAKEATKSFDEHEFIFTNSAREAIELLATADGIVTDLFFPPEIHADGGELDLAYAVYRSKTANNPVFDTVVREYYRGDQWHAEDRLTDALALMGDGTIREVIERLIESFEHRRDHRAAKEYRERLQNLPAPQFPYGGALMLRAKELGKRHCLVSNIHRHAGSYTNVANAVDAMVLLLPLMNEGIITVKQATDNGRGSLTYLGSSEIGGAIEEDGEWRKQHRGACGKEHPAVWIDALNRLLAQ